MAKKKDKPQVINNIGELNLEIDYDKLAEAIVKIQNAAKEESQPTEKIGFWKAVWKIIFNKEDKNGKRTAVVLAEIMACIFNVAAILGVFFAVVIFSSIFKLEWNIAWEQIVARAIFIAILFLISLSIALIFRGVANEIGAEKDRNYITTLFFGFTSLASLIVALVALFKEVG